MFNRKTAKAGTALMAAAMVLQMASMPVCAAAPQSKTSDAADKTFTVPVTADVTSFYVVEVPAQIAMTKTSDTSSTGKNYAGTGSVRVYGALDDNETVTVSITAPSLTAGSETAKAQVSTDSGTNWKDKAEITYTVDDLEKSKSFSMGAHLKKAGTWNGSANISFTSSGDSTK